MLKLNSVFLFCLVTLFALPLCAAQPDATEPYVVTMSTIYPLSHPVMRDILRPWAETVMEESRGRLVIRIFAGGSIVPLGSHGNAVRLGQVGIGVDSLNENGDYFPLSVLAMQRPGNTALKELSAAYWRICTEIPEVAAEFNGIKLLAVYATDPLQFCMIDKLPYSVELFAGMRFLTNNRFIGKKMEALGALVTPIVQDDLAMFLDDKKADAAIMSLTSLHRLGLDGRFGGVVLGDLENGVLFMGLHQGIWDALPQDLRDILNKNSGLKLSQRLGEAVSKDYREKLAKMQNSATQLHYLSAEERAVLYAGAQATARDAWQDLAREKGFNSKTLQDRIAKIFNDAKIN